MALYLDTSNKLNLAVRDSGGGWLTLIIFTDEVGTTATRVSEIDNNGNKIARS